MIFAGLPESLPARRGSSIGHAVVPRPGGQTRQSLRGLLNAAEMNGVYQRHSCRNFVSRLLAGYALCSC
jgi:hypothetical protein